MCNNVNNGWNESSKNHILLVNSDIYVDTQLTIRIITEPTTRHLFTSRLSTLLSDNRQVKLINESFMKK